jgi:AraC-like DNA-binding protein
MSPSLAHRLGGDISLFDLRPVPLDGARRGGSLRGLSALFQPFPMLAGRRAQIWRHQPEFRRPRHFHPEPELNVVVAGRCLLGVGDRTFSLSAGEMLLFQPGQDHALLGASEDLDLFVLALTPELAERAVGLRTLSSGVGGIFRVPNPGAVAQELAGLGRVADGLAVETRLAEQFVRALGSGPVTHALVRRAVEIVRTEPCISGGALARRLSAAPSLVSRRFHGDFGVPLVEYRARTKLMRFIALVDAGQPLTRAAFEAEFGSYAQCHRVFDRALGCSPSAYFAGARARLDAATVAPA